MSLRAWSWIAGFSAVLFLLIPFAYTWYVVNHAPDEVWSWGHQFVATFFSVGFTAAVAVWLYTWQTRRTVADRKRDLRGALLTAIFDIRDLVDDKNLKTIRFPDGSEEKVLLTFLQPTIFEEAMRSGLFGANETLILSRMAGIAQTYNAKATRFMEGYSALKARGGTPVESSVVEQLRDQLYDVQDDVQQIVTGVENLMKSWSFEELTEAFNVAKPEDSGQVDPRVEQLLRQFKLRVSPPSYKAGVQHKIWEVEDAIEAGDFKAARELADGLVEEVHAMPKDRGSDEEAADLIASVHELREKLSNLPDPESEDESTELPQK